MSANSNDLHAMRTLLQETHTGAMDRTGMLPFPLEPMAILVNDYRRSQAQLSEYDMVLNSLGEAGKLSAAQKIRDHDADSRDPEWRCNHIKRYYWTKADWALYWTTNW